MKANVEVTQTEDGTWLSLGKERISLSHSPGENLHEFFINNLPVRGHTMQRTVAYVTGAFALLLVTGSAVAALLYAATHHLETLNNLASSTLSGIGIAIGGCLGSALILRFKAARHYLRSVLKDLQ